MGRSGSLRKNEESCGIGSTRGTLGVIDLGNLDGQKSYGSQVAGTIKYKKGEWRGAQGETGVCICKRRALEE